MKNLKILLFALFAFWANQTVAQRILEEIVPFDDEPLYIGKAVLGENIFIAEAYQSFLYQYNGTDLLTINFPFKGGAQLFHYGGDIVIYEASIYLLLSTNFINTFLYRFDGTTFTEITVPDWPWEILTFKNKLYIMTEPSFGYLQLYSYDGTTMVSEGSTFPNSDLNFTFEVAGDYLYFGGENYTIDVNREIARHDGTTTIPLPLFTGNVVDIVEIPGTEDAYIYTGSSILKFDGANLTPIFTRPGGAIITTLLDWRGGIYFQVSYATASGMHPVLYKYEGSLLSTVSLPAGNHPIPLAEGTIYEDNFYIPTQFADATQGVLSYNGTTFSDFFLFPEATDAPRLFERGEDLVIIPQHQESDTVYAFNDLTFTAITSPIGTKIYDYLTGVECFHLWSISNDSSDYVLTKETVCSETYTIIPEALRNYDQVAFGITGKYRDWCWTDIFFDWQINPICPIPETCPDPLFQTTLTDLKGKVGFQEKFEKPFQINIPLLDSKSYQFLLTSLTGSLPENLFIIDHDLVAKGFSEIHMSMVPTQNFFKLTVNTDKDNMLPFVMKLLNKEGEIIWQQDYMAPITTEINAFVDDPGGTTLQFSSFSKDVKDLKDYGVSRINFYPNPSYGRLEVDISTAENTEVPLELNVYNTQGKMLLKKEVLAPVHQPVDLNGLQPGIYIIQLKAGDAVYTDFVVLKY